MLFYFWVGDKLLYNLLINIFFFNRGFFNNVNCKDIDKVKNISYS